MTESSPVQDAQRKLHDALFSLDMLAPGDASYLTSKIQALIEAVVENATPRTFERAMTPQLDAALRNFERVMEAWGRYADDNPHPKPEFWITTTPEWARLKSALATDDPTKRT